MRHYRIVFCVLLVLAVAFQVGESSAGSYEESNKELKREIDEESSKISNKEIISLLVQDSIFNDCKEAVYHANKSIVYKDYEATLRKQLAVEKMLVKRKYEKELVANEMTAEEAQLLLTSDQQIVEDEFEELSNSTAGKWEDRIGRVDLLIDRIRENIKYPPSFKVDSFTGSTSFVKEKLDFLSSDAVKLYRKNEKMGLVPDEMVSRIDQVFAWLSYAPTQVDKTIIDPEIVNRL
ncbi:hypothetical protein [Desulfatibacillum aliphaticivorans]|uniref:hypothetical protein n=1 Tax=Desulfatibacillum aliphaticivorans TaxID=218208 RepID=UPI0004084A72|nr:hypothetical protein [Desulfatibacillum aliphaticivorans]